MNILNQIESMELTKYSLAKHASLPYTTICDICSGKAKIENCTALTVYKLAKALNTSVEDLLESAISPRPDFSIFKSNICHQLKALGDLDFIKEHLVTNPVVFKFYNKGWYAESLYLVAMIDYLSRENNIPLYTGFDELRMQKLENIVYPKSILAEYLLSNDMSVKTNAYQNSIPEFRRFNIVEKDVRDVV